jgi:hypothetical protein
VDLADAGRLLAKVQAYDRRTVGKSDIDAWYEALDDVDLPPALAAVTQHYRQTTEFIMPAHIRALVSQPPNQQPLATLPHPPEFDAGRARRWSRECRAALARARGDTAS